MIERHYLFKCDRCGKEMKSIFHKFTNTYNVCVLVSTDADTKRDYDSSICGDCYRDLREVMDNFFDDVNKDEGESLE